MSISGRVAWAMLLGLVPAVLWPGWPVLLGWVGIVLVAVLVDLVLAGSPRAVRVEREPVAAVRLGQPTTASFVLSNTGRRRVHGLVRDGWQPSAGAAEPRQRLDLPAGQQRRLSTALIPTRRGDRRAAHVTIRSTGPLGLAARQLTLTAPGMLRVLPSFGSRKHLPGKLARLRELDGRTALRVRGQGTEFDSLRDYVDGDDVRSIDWRASARRQQIVVRTWRPERDRRVLLVLDTSRTSAARVGDEPRLDAAMDAALLLAALASRAGDRVDLLAMDRRVRARVEGASRTDLLPRLVTAMAPLEADLVEADWSAIVSTVLGRLSQRSLVILLTPLEAAAVEEGLLPVVQRLSTRHRVLVASVADPQVALMAAGRGDSYAVYGAAAAERAEVDRAATTAELRRLGVDVVDAPPELLPPQLADRYLSLKAAGLL
ncbi:MAG TPA: DUF58 domain-containing protein [Kineosporiaceae bacterium]|nr:DUF58 domain-containing protein [Kineosporiaceae bacterium]